MIKFENEEQKKGALQLLDSLVKLLPQSLENIPAIHKFTLDQTRDVLKAFSKNIQNLHIEATQVELTVDPTKCRCGSTPRIFINNHALGKLYSCPSCHIVTRNIYLED